MYRESKAIETAAYFLRKNEGWAMDYYDLVKLIYLADREQVRMKGRTITGDDLYSLPWGPIVSHVLDAIQEDVSDEWTAHIATDKALKRSKLVVDAPPSSLSRADLQAIEAVWERFGHMDGPQLTGYTHRLPEYTDTDGRIPISLEEVARGVGRTEDEIDAILDEQREREAVQRFKASLKRVASHV